ncbi:MAG: SDR family NAD(P)-dependent oxidoreductase [Spirochaetales bacterium]|nr:SDR family NAD(P)-dependent oxidoreductase [Spirochaetales bacterium]
MTGRGRFRRTGRRLTVKERDRRRLAGLTVAITGSSAGIGRETARILLDCGATVVINGRDQERLERTRRDLSDDTTATRFSAVRADVATEEGAALIVSHAIERWGRLDGLINNAGVSMRGPAADLRAAALDRLIQANLRSAVLPTVAALPELTRNRGRVLFVSTVAALHGFPGVSLYSATKGAIERFAEGLAAEVGLGGVSVGTVFLGFVENDPDKTTLSAEGTPFRHERRATHSQKEAASHIVRCLARRTRRHITIPAGRLLDVAHRLSPTAVTRVLTGSKGSIHAVDARDGAQNRG